MTEPDAPGLPGGDDLDDVDPDDIADEDRIGDGPAPAGEDVDPGSGDPPGPVFDLDDSDTDGGGLRSTPIDDRARAEALERRLVLLEDRLASVLAAAEAAAQAAARAGAAAEAVAEVAAQAPTETAPVVKTPTYQALAEFVSNEFSPLYTRRRHGGRWRWCARWWEHAEAVSRLGALHLAWEALHDDGPTGMGTWYRDHLDHQLPILMGADGPFRRCDDQHYPLDPDDELTCGTPRWDNIVWRVDEAAA